MQGPKTEKPASEISGGGLPKNEQLGGQLSFPNNEVATPTQVPPMSRGEREDLQRLVRQREKVLKSAARQRSAELLADFENQMGQQYSFDQDTVWEQAVKSVEPLVAKAKAQIADRCRELGIPRQFAPDVDLGWHHRGYVACLTAMVLLAIPLIWGWRAVFSRSPGKALTVLYFACLGAGYIMVEVGLIAHFVMALGNPTISASVLITGMLVFSGLGALASERALPHMRTVMPILFVAVGVMLILYGLYLGRVLELDRRARLSGPPRRLLPFDRPARLPDGLPDADRDDDARTSRQRSHVCLGMGRQRLLFGDRGRRGARYRDQFRPCSGDRVRRPGLSVGDSRLLWRHRFGPRTRSW